MSGPGRPLRNAYACFAVLICGAMIVEIWRNQPLHSNTVDGMTLDVFNVSRAEGKLRLKYRIREQERGSCWFRLTYLAAVDWYGSHVEFLRTSERPSFFSDAFREGKVLYSRGTIDVDIPAEAATFDFCIRGLNVSTGRLAIPQE